MEYGKRINKCEKKVCKSALRTCCAERTRAMLLAACVHQVLVPSFSRNVCVREDKGHKYENCIPALIFIVVNVILMGVCFDFYYDLNDDTMMHDIMSGIYSGTPDGHNMQTLYPLGALIALCYRLCRSVPWYGLFLCLCQFGCFYLIGVRLCELFGSAHRRFLLLLGLSLCMWGICLPHLVSIQYTITCAMLSAAAVFLFLTTPDGLGTRQFVVKNIPSVILVVAAYQLRSEMLLLTFPLICLAGLYRLVGEKKIFLKENIGKYGGVLGMIFVGMLLSFVADEVAYGSAQWKEFREFFDARTTVYDFYPELITDENYGEALTELGVAPYQQTLLNNYNFGLDDAVDTELMTRLADYAVHTIGASKDWGEIFREKFGFYRYRTFHSGDAPYNVMVLWAYTAVFLTGFREARRSGVVQDGSERGMLLRYGFVWQLILLIAVRSGLWMFILMRGRDPVRITHSLYLAEFALLTGMLLRRLQTGRGDTGSAVRGSTVTGSGVARGMAVLAGLILAGALTGNLTAVREDQDRREWVNTDRNEIDTYCRGHEENFYFEDVYSTVSFSCRLFDASDNGYANYDIMGGWMCKSPLYYEKLQRSGIEGAGEAMCEGENAYLIMSDLEAAERGFDWITDYYAAQGTTTRIEEVDVIGENVRYHVYRIGTK